VRSDRDLLALHELRPARYPHLLESVLHGTPHGRFDILFAFPGETLALDADGTLRGAPPGAHGFIDAFDRLWRASARPGHALPGLPFRGGWLVFLGYELAAEIEPRLRLPRADTDFPVALATRFPAAVIRDRQARCLYLVAEEGQAPLLDQMAADLTAAMTVAPAPSPQGVLADQLHEADAAAYLAAVRRIKRYIYEGDVFQVNLARRWRGRTAPGVTHAALYRRLRRHNPGPFAALASWGPRAILSSSPERLVQVHDAGIQTRPIAGTRPRGSEVALDRELAVDLLANAKERAEHVMLIDLERNDLGRICTPGSVEVDELMTVESYAHVHHIVSNVRGRLRAGVTPGAVIRAVFPGGTITGCPKVRCMEIIAELERVGRGPYTGSLGYVNVDGSMDLNILIRSILRAGEQIDLHAGAGIVADSDPDRELEETRSKARGLMLALDDRGG
jgi:anthranilate synthase component 1